MPIKRPREYPKRKAQYYIRVNYGGRWYFLWQVKKTGPEWQAEDLVTNQVPYLYKTLVGARNAMDIYVSSLTQGEVAIWQAKEVVDG